MTTKDVRSQLERISSMRDFAFQTELLAESWTKSKIGIKAVGQILQFIEDHPSLDYGSPGALVHFVETFYGRGYEESLLESLKRRPTLVTVLMLNALNNSARNEDEKKQLVAALNHLRNHPRIDKVAHEHVCQYIEMHS